MFSTPHSTVASLNLPISHYSLYPVGLGPLHRLVQSSALGHFCLYNFTTRPVSLNYTQCFVSPRFPYSFFPLSSPPLHHHPPSDARKCCHAWKMLVTSPWTAECPEKSCSAGPAAAARFATSFATRWSRLGPSWTKEDQTCWKSRTESCQTA